MPDAEGLWVGVDGVGVARSSEASGRRRTKRTMTTITDPTISSHLTDDLIRSPTSFVLPRLPRPHRRAGHALVYAFPNFRAEDGCGLDIIIDLLKFGIIFGILATAPIVTWLAVSWLVTDRRRTSSRPDES